MSRTRVVYAAAWVGIPACSAVLMLSHVYIVPTDSMRPVLRPGDIVWCLPYLHVRRGDVVAFEAPGTGQQGIKRIVGLPGETVRYAEKQLWIDKRLAPKTLKATLPATDSADILHDQILFDTSFELLENFGPSLSQGEWNGPGYFVMGDNRDNSLDSRHFGRLTDQQIECKATIVFATEVSGKIRPALRLL